MHLATSAAPNAAVPFIACSRLAAIPKKNGDIRPLGIGTVIARVIGRTFTSMFRPTTKQAPGGGQSEITLSPLGQSLIDAGQCGALARGGQDILIKTTQMALDLHPDWLFIELDGQNAHAVQIHSTVVFTCTP